MRSNALAIEGWRKQGEPIESVPLLIMSYQDPITVRLFKL